MTGRLTPRSVSRPLEAVVRRLRLLSALSDAELELLRNLGDRRERHIAGDELTTEGDYSGRPRFILSGWACRQRVLPDGRRQIFGFLLPGDGFGLNRRPGPELSTITAVTVLETVDAEPVLEAVQAGRAPGLARALAASEPVEQKLMLDHMVRLGRQTAYERVAHFLLELQRRLEIAGLGDSQRFPLPLTQEIMADALGLSIVHVNRTLQQLRRERLIELRSGVTILLQRETLASIADYQAPARAAAASPLIAAQRADLEDSASA
jgi:CRP-like cAMP-binding protein